MKLTIKIFALFLMLVLMGTMTTTICADGSGSSSVTATVIANNSPLYSVSIPTGISADNLQRTAESSYKDTDFAIQVMDAIALNGQKIYVKVSSDNGSFVLKNANGTSTLPYAVYAKNAPETPITYNGVFATFEGQEKQMGFIRIDQKDIRQADTYTGNLRFTFYVAD